ncbi:ROK family protein [bacterium]|nr:ROK family protein [bacterium]
MGYYIIGMDLGGTKIASALLDTDLDVVKSDTVYTRTDAGPEGVADQMAEAVERLTEGIGKESVLGVGVASAGLVEPGTGNVLYSPNLQWRDVPLRRMLSERLHQEVYVDNDVNMAALGELHFGAGKGVRHMVCVFVGTGIGSGIVIDGHLYEGANGFAGEVGHTTIQWDGPPCPSGNPGCWESYASGTAMARRAREALDRGEQSLMPELVGGDLSKLRVEVISEAELRGDALARRIIEETGEFLGAGLSNLVNTLNPDLIVLGGGVIRGVPQLYELAQASVRRRALPDAVEALRFAKARFGREAGVIGAGVLVKLAGRP